MLIPGYTNIFGVDILLRFQKVRLRITMDSSETTRYEIGIAPFRIEDDSSTVAAPAIAKQEFFGVAKKAKDL